MLYLIVMELPPGWWKMPFHCLFFDNTGKEDIKMVSTASNPFTLSVPFE